MITHIHTISIYVSDQDRALAFYRDALLPFLVGRG